MESLAQPTDFPDLFRTYILNSAEDALAQLDQSDEPIHNAEDRDTLLNTLEFALGYPETASTGFDILQALAPRMEQAGYRKSWLPYLLQGIERSQIEENPWIEAWLQLQLGTLHQLMGALDDAVNIFAECQQRFSQLKDDLHQAQALNRLAHVKRSQQGFDEAIAFAHQALELLDDDAPERAYAHSVLGGVHFDQGAFEAAIEAYQKALKIRQAEGNRRLVAWNLNNIGAARKRLNQYDAAIENYQQIIELLSETEDPVLHSVAKMNLGNVYLEMKQPQQALAFYQQAKEPLQETHSEWYLAMLFNNLGQAYYGLARLDEAELAYQESIGKYRILRNYPLMADAVDNLAEVYLDKNATDKAVSLLRNTLSELKTACEPPVPSDLYQPLCERLQKIE